MKMIKVMILLMVLFIGLINRHHHKPEPVPTPQSKGQPAAVNREILQNAEHLAETLQKCKQTARNNKGTQ